MYFVYIYIHMILLGPNVGLRTEVPRDWGLAAIEGAWEGWFGNAPNSLGEKGRPEKDIMHIFLYTIIYIYIYIGGWGA